MMTANTQPADDDKSPATFKVKYENLREKQRPNIDDKSLGDKSVHVSS